MINSETIGSVALIGSYDSNISVAVITYSNDLIASGVSGDSFSASNDTINYATGDLTVTAVPRTVTTSDQVEMDSKKLSQDSNAFTVRGLVSSENVGSVILTSVASYDTNANASTTAAAVGIYSDNLVASGDSFNISNYSLYALLVLITGLLVTIITIGSSNILRIVKSLV